MSNEMKLQKYYMSVLFPYVFFNTFFLYRNKGDKGIRMHFMMWMIWIHFKK